MDNLKIPFKEIALVFIIICVSISVSQIEIKSQYVKYITGHPAIRFFLMFSLALLIFSLDIGPDYHIITRVISALIIAGVFELLFTSKDGDEKTITPNINSME